MSKELLDGFEIGTAVKQMGHEGVAQDFGYMSFV